MLPETHPLIEAVTEPLAHNAEHRLAAHVVLEETFDAEHPDTDEALARLEFTKQQKFPGFLKALLWVIAIIALSSVNAPYAPAILKFEKRSFSSIFELTEQHGISNNLTEKERLILGDPELSELEQKSRLHFSDPENPAYYRDYVLEWTSERGSLPENYFETVAAIDPSNAFFSYFAAAEMGDKSYERQKDPSGSRPDRVVDGVTLKAVKIESKFTILDQANYEKSLALIEQAAKLPNFNTYTNELLTEKARILPVNTFAEFVFALAQFYNISSPSFSLRRISELLSARAEELSQNGNKEEFVKLAAQRDAYIRQLAQNPNKYLVNELVYGTAAFETALNFHAAANRLGLTNLAETYRKQSETFQEYDDKRKIRANKSDAVYYPMERTPILYGLTAPGSDGFINSTMPISDSDLEPMRRVEHELAAGMGIRAVASLIVFTSLLVFFYRFIVPQSIRLPAKRMACLLRISDWVWVLGLGVALPIVIFLIITRLTPLGGRDLSVTHHLYVFPGVHLVALLLSLLIVPAFVVRRRLVKRLAPFRLPDRFGRFPLLVIAGLVAWSLSAQPIIQHFGFSQKILYVFAAPPALCICFLFANALRVIFERSSTRFAQIATALAVLPVYPIAIVALCLLTPIYQAGEKYWLAKETLLRIDPDAPDLGAYEFKIAAQKRKETNQILGFK